MRRLASVRHWWLAFVVLLTAALAQSACTETESNPKDDDDSDGGSAGSIPTGGNGAAGGQGGGGALPACPPVYSTVPVGECDLYHQDCPPGMGCEPNYSGTTTECVFDTGVRGPGDPCADNAVCQAGLFCVFGFCAAICCDINNAPCGEGICIVNSDVGSGNSIMTCLSAPNCELFSGMCLEGTACFPLYNAGRSVCVPPTGSQSEGEDCGSLNECLDSMTCLNGFCRHACYLDSNEPAGSGGCPTGQTCRAVGSNPPPNTGACDV